MKWKKFSEEMSTPDSQILVFNKETTHIALLWFNNGHLYSEGYECDNQNCNGIGNCMYTINPDYIWTYVPFPSI